MIVATRLSSAESWWWFEQQSMLDTDFSEVLINFYVREGEGEGGLSSIVNIELYPVSSSWLWGIAVSYHLWNFRVLKNLTNKPQPSSQQRYFYCWFRFYKHVISSKWIAEISILLQPSEKSIPYCAISWNYKADNFLYIQNKTNSAAPILQDLIGDSSLDLISGYFTWTSRISFRLMILARSIPSQLNETNFEKTILAL